MAPTGRAGRRFPLVGQALNGQMATGSPDATEQEEAGGGGEGPGAPPGRQPKAGIETADAMPLAPEAAGSMA